MKQLQTLKSDIATTRIVESSYPKIGDNEIIVSIENFAFTTNNVTYAVAGDTIGYWRFFKTTKDPENEWGSIPVWGFAKVLESNLKEISVGERLFGYFPPSDRLHLNPIKITDQGFTDGKDYRKELPAVYNNYVRLSGDPDYDDATDNIRSLLFPLHITSFCLCDAMEDKSFYQTHYELI